MFYSSFYTPFQYSFYPYFMPSFARPIGFVVSPDGAMDNWWGKKPSWWGKSRLQQAFSLPLPSIIRAV
ncbi:hypothetical protein [Priestia megaterium]|uniref:hypothetical protein n=1 Tax=Priestia megaterium TaxID=1404 RepID=UPI00101C5B70|nr:hypothetical protein [Priestia megaterium]